MWWRGRRRAVWAGKPPPSLRMAAQRRLPRSVGEEDQPSSREQSERVAVFFTSDTHFADHRVLNLYPRPFGSVAEMDAALVERWNATVTLDDEVWHLGDFARTVRAAGELLPRLRGAKHLVTGNNDPPAVATLGWASVQPYAETSLDGVALVLCHSRSGAGTASTGAR